LEWLTGTRIDLPSIAGKTVATLIVAASDSKYKDRADYVCDGVSDQEEINNAKDALPTTGGRIILLEGTYIIDGRINLDKNNIVLEGQGPGTVIKLKDGYDTGIDMIRVYNKSNIRIANLKIDGNRDNVTKYYEHRGVMLDYYANKVKVEGLTIVNCNGPGIRVNNRSYYNIIIGNFISGCGAPDVAGYAGGITIMQSNRNIVADNVCIANKEGGIYIGGGTVTADRNLVIGNVVQENEGLAGIHLEGAQSYNIVAFNQCLRNKLDGIMLYDGVSHCSIIGNVCIENGQAADNVYSGIRLGYNCDYNNIQFNTCRIGGLTNRPKYGISIDDADCDANIVTNNDLYNSGATGSLNDGGTGTITAAGNRL